MIGDILIGRMPHPDNWMYCDGRSLNIADYPDLFAVIGTKYGGDGVTTFNIPHMGCIDSMYKMYIVSQ